MSDELAPRELATQRLYRTLFKEIVPAVPASLWDQLSPGGLVDRADRALLEAANRYEDGHGSRGAVLAAADQLRSTWRSAIARNGSIVHGSAGVVGSP